MFAETSSSKTTRAWTPGRPAIPTGFAVGAAVLVLFGAFAGGFFGAIAVVTALLLLLLVLQVGALARVLERRFERERRHVGAAPSGASSSGASSSGMGSGVADSDGSDPTGSDLARIAGLLEDLRDMQRRLDDRLVAVAERASAPQAYAAAGVTPEAGAAPTASLLVERALNRLLALGFEQIEVITPREEVAAAGGLVVEARRGGAVHKGTVRFVDGVIADVEMRPAHDLFP